MKKIALLILFTLNLLANERIVTLAPSINEIIFALDLGDNVVANTQFCDFPKESQRKEKIGGYSSISLEKILKVKPTVIVGQDYDLKLISNLNALNLKTKIYKTTTLEDIKNTILDLGEYFNKKQNAKELVENINKELDSLKDIIKNKKILFVISPKKDLKNQIYVTGNHIYFEDILKASNNQNAFYSTSSMQPVINAEKVVNINPDIIILLGAFFENRQEEKKEVINAWMQLPTNASKQNNIYIIDKEYAGIPSHRVVYFIKDFKKILENVRDKKL